ncbi:unnamed protein product [Rhizophagus irregularis]|nr:unnamed protein product [Rhizophagus irregularis]
MQQKFYSLLIRKCLELKYLDIRSIKPQTFYFPEAKDRLESLCELKCDTSIDSSYFYGLLPFCQYIQKLIIINIDSKPNHGIVKLIEAQKNLKHFEWEDDIRNSHLTEDPSEEVFRALTKKADSLNHLIIYFRCIGGFESALPQEILPKFYKLKTLVFDDLRPFTEEQLEQLRIQVYRDLEIVNLERCGFDVITKIIENSGGCIKKILFRDNNKFRCLTFYEDSLNFIRKVYENCPLIEYLTITLSLSKKHFDEFEKLLKICQNLKSLLITIDNLYAIETDEEILEYGKIFLETLNRSAPINLQEIRFYDDFKFSLENLEEFLEKWRGRSAISILTSDSIYEGENYKKLINKYQRYGVIKDFEHNLNDYEIHYPFKF